MTYTIKSVVEHHSKSSLKKLDFNCGDDSLNQYLKRFSFKNDAQLNSAKVFVVTEDDKPEQVLGYYTSSASEIMLELLPNDKQQGLPQKIPCLLLGRLAVDSRHQKRGVGKELLKHFFINSVDVSSKTGVFAVYTQAKDQNAFDYYFKNGFEVLVKQEKLLYLPIKTLEKL